GRPLLPRDCEVPEFKHACLGGIYAMKSALRLLASDGADRQAIVVSADIAEYERGSTGEQTQGAGAVAMLLEANPRLLSIDLKQSGSASDYRTNDFRKPFSRFTGQRLGANGQLQDFPLFNGGYSTDCYLEATVEAVRNMLDKRGARHGYLESLPAVFMHRPYKRMPETGLALCTLFALGSGDSDARAELARYCELAGVAPEDVLAEIWSSPRVSNTMDRDAGPVYPHSQNVLRAFRGKDGYRTRILAKQALGADMVAELGNLYTASLPAWLAAGLEEAATKGTALAGEEVLMIGYGSGDAAEAIPAELVPGWEDYAIKSGIAESLRNSVPLDQQDYEAFHSGEGTRPERPVANEFIISRIGTCTSANAADLGIEYYEYVS
ncbi:MAG: hydroxymethylglutaryl-CoA synthase, partial [Pseudomonadota bacterium]